MAIRLQGCLSRQKYHTLRCVQSPLGRLFINKKSKLQGRYPTQKNRNHTSGSVSHAGVQGIDWGVPCRRTSSWWAPPGKSFRSSSLLGRIGSWGYSRPLCLPVHLSGKTNSFLKGASPSVAGVLHSADWRHAMDALWLRLVDIGGISPPPPLPWAAWPEGLGPGCHNIYDIGCLCIQTLKNIYIY